MSTKHQPCGKPGCINCWAPATVFDGQAQYNNPHRNAAYDPIKREQILGTMNDKRIRNAQREMNINAAAILERIADRSSRLEEESLLFKTGQMDASRRMVKLIMKITIFFVLALGSGALALMVIT